MKLLQFQGSWLGPILHCSAAAGLSLWYWILLNSDVLERTTLSEAPTEAEPEVPAQSSLRALGQQPLPEVTGQQRSCEQGLQPRPHPADRLLLGMHGSQ